MEQTFQQVPARGRVDQTVSLILSSYPKTEEWIKEFTAQHPQARAYVGVFINDLLNSNDPWFVRNKFISQLFSRDLFDYTLPLDNDLFFFGRQAIVAEHIDAIRRSENRGLFGLRKTGKTSVLFKIMRQCAENTIPVKYYDCKVSSIYRLSGDELLDRISSDIEEIIDQKLKGWRNKKTPTDRFLSLIEKIPATTRFCLIFDEIEYVSVGSKLAPHWVTDFVPFWQALWSAQSQFRKFSFIVSGVNASISETDKIEGVQNPMFGIVKARYLTGFERGELRSLTNVFGKRMGLHFDESAVDALYERYGGHPLLTRMICSQINTGIKVSGQPRPISLSKAEIRKDLNSREEDIQFYCGHITSELEEFYPTEYDMLELLSVGNIIDFNDLAEDIDLVRHLKAYGLIDLSKAHEPQFKIPVIQGYVASKWRRRNSLKTNRYVVPPHRRQEFVASRTSSILREMRAAERKFDTIGLPALYRGNGPSEAELFASVRECSSREEMVAFLNQANRSLVEPIDREGKRLSKKDYFFGDIKSNYTKLWTGLNRVRAYRNHLLHLELTPIAKNAYEDFLQFDLDGQDPSNSVDGWFQLQSAILNGLLIALQAEMAIYD